MPLATKKQIIAAQSETERTRVHVLELSEKISYYGFSGVLLTAAGFGGIWPVLATTAVLVPGYLLGALNGAPMDSTDGQQAFFRTRDFHAQPLSSAGSIVEGIKIGLYRDNVLKYSAKSYKIIAMTLAVLGGGLAFRALPKKSQEALKARLIKYANDHGVQYSEQTQPAIEFVAEPRRREETTAPTSELSKNPGSGPG